MFSSFMVALTLTSVANVLIIMALSPLFTALFARFFLNHKLPLITWLAIVVAGMGIVWMFVHEDWTALSFVGSCVALTIPIAAAINFTILQSVGMHRKSENISGDRPFDMPHALILGAIISTCTTLPFALPLQASMHDIKLLSFLGVFQLALPCYLVIHVSKVLPAPEITLLSLLEVIFGVTWAWLWAGEALTWNTILGGLMVVGALFVNAFTKIVSEQKKILLT
jgi:drug/metabolite transporter (DMT)-like permease